MFNVTISFDGGQWHFMFKDEERARALLAELIASTNDYIIIGDEFGAEAVIFRNIIRAIIIEDLSKSGEAQIERSMVNARNQAKFQNKAQSDTLVRMMQPMTQPNGPFMRS